MDIKAENVLIDKKMKILLVDFGYANDKDITELVKYRGSETYISPEIIERKVYDGTKADIFSLGVLLFFITFAGLPFENAKLSDSHFKLLHDKNYETYW